MTRGGIGGLAAYRGALSVYCRVLAGRELPLRPTDALVELGLGWHDAHLPASDGEGIYLPAEPPAHLPAQRAAAWYKVAATQQLGHLLWGSYGRVPADRTADTAAQEAAAAEGAPAAGALDLNSLSQFFWSLPDPWLAHALYATLEQSRIARRACERLPGLGADYRALARHELDRRLRCAVGTAPREAFVELLLRRTLGDDGDHPTLGAQLARSLAQVHAPGAGVAATIDAVVQAIRSLGGTQPGDGHGAFSTAPTRLRPAAPVSHFGAFKPELVQLRQTLQRPRPSARHGLPGAPDSSGRRELQRYLERAGDVETAPDGPPAKVQRRLLAADIERQWQAEDLHAMPQAGHPPGDPDAGEPPEPPEPPTALPDGRLPYDEWSVHRARYLRGHCGVLERPMPLGEAAYYHRVLRQRPGLAAQVRRQLASIPLQQTRRQRRLLGGPELDLDAGVEAQVARRLGVSPDERVFQARRQVVRSVAVALLVDLSASTAERLPPAPAATSASAVERVIDVQKQALCLMLDGLAKLGDAYAIYGFSGYRASRVDFFVIKAFDEHDIDTVARRIDAIRPQYATRMGAAIRHCTTRMGERPERTRVMLMLSDGRPQDAGYSEGGRQPRYAIADTRMAILEARRRAVQPFCLTVDRNGQDYLAAMGLTGASQVVGDVRRLPTVLPQVYAALTSGT